MKGSSVADSPAAVLGQVAFLESAGRGDQAIALLKRALVDHPESAELHSRLGSMLTAYDRTSEAVFHLERGLELDPSGFDAYDKLGTYLQRLGRFEEARQAFLRAIDKHPDAPSGYFGFLLSKRVEIEDLPLLSRLAAALEGGSWPPLEQEMSQYGLGKAFDDLGDYERAMAHFDGANALANQRRIAKGIRFDREAYRTATDFFIRTFNREFMRRNAGQGVDSALPVLIVGMMRSGTTLLEQMLSAHPRVAAGGELPFWQSPAARHVGTSAADGFLPAELARELAENYRRLLRSIGPQALRVTDKNPFNYFSIGLIHLLFPNVRFVHCRRNSLDCCLSIYTTPVGESGLEFLHVKENIVFGYQEYERLMDHWRSVIPSDLLIEVEYEKLVGRPRVEMERVLSAIGIPWDDACLHPEANERVVQTPSRWQVRQPIYASSVDRWRNYRSHLGAFASLAGPASRGYLD